MNNCTCGHNKDTHGKSTKPDQIAGKCMKKKCRCKAFQESPILRGSTVTYNNIVPGAPYLSASALEEAHKLARDQKCGNDGKTMWCYCGKCKQEDYQLPEDFNNLLTSPSPLEDK